MVICINNQKGGTGKTTTTLELAYLFTILYKLRVLVVDLDPQCSLTKRFGYKRDTFRGKSIYEVMLSIVHPEASIIDTKYSNLYLLPATKDLAMLDIDLALKYQTRYVFDLLKTTLGKVTDNFDIIILDTLPSSGATALNAFSFADYLLIPTLPEQASLEGLEDLLENVRMIRNKMNTGLHLLGILPFAFDKRLSHHKKALTALNNVYSKKFNVPILKNQIGTCTLLKDNVVLKEPASKIYPNERVTESFTKLCVEIAEIIGFIQ